MRERTSFPPRLLVLFLPSVPRPPGSGLQSWKHDGWRKEVNPKNKHVGPRGAMARYAVPRLLWLACSCAWRSERRGIESHIVGGPVRYLFPYSHRTGNRRHAGRCCICGRSSMVEHQPSKLNVARSSRVARCSKNAINCVNNVVCGVLLPPTKGHKGTPEGLIVGEFAPEFRPEG